MSVWSFLHPLQWRLRARRFRQRPSLPAVLLYHSIGDRRRDPLCLATTVSHFEDQLRWLAKVTTPLRLEEFIERMVKGTLPINAVALTFDDGYADNFLLAELLLRQSGIPATVFLATATLGTTEEPWWETLDAILLESAELPAHFSWRGLAFSVEPRPDPARAEWTVLAPPVTKRERAFLQTSTFAQHLSPSDRTLLLRALSAWANAQGGARPDRRMATWEEVRRATQAGVISVGGHTRFHSCLAALSQPEQREEISNGLDDIERGLGFRPDTFAYPFGTYRDFSPMTRAVVRRSGLRSAFANMPGAITSRTDRWQIPRFLVRNEDAASLARRLGQ